MRIPWDAIDYGDYTHNANESVLRYWSLTRHPEQSRAGVSLQYPSAEQDPLIVREDVQNAQNHRVNDTDSVNNGNHRNQYDPQYPKAALQIERYEIESAPDTSDSSPSNARASPCVQDRKHCLHHPHARWVRFDPSGQAWCDKMNCWDCYRLMKIGEVLDYRPLSNYSRGIVSVGQGIEAWSSFVTSQGSFAVLTATQYAIDLCKRLRLEVPDLSGEVKQLVKARVVSN